MWSYTEKGRGDAAMRIVCGVAFARLMIGSVLVLAHLSGCFVAMNMVHCSPC